MNSPRLTVGMACYDDFEGVWFTVTALRLYHAETMPEIEIVVVDNHPDSIDGEFVRQFLDHWVPAARYVEFRSPVGTAAPRDEVFRQARAEAVLCVDSHVLLEPGALARLIEFYGGHPDCLDLLQGPLVYDDLQSYSSHFDDQWRDQMWGVWGCDPRAEWHRETRTAVDRATGERSTSVLAREQPPFEIPAQGLGLFSCRRAAWLGFHPDFRWFGGEEFYIHEKFRQAGRRTLCLPFLRWIHRFNRPRGIPYPLTAEHKFRNYVLALTELGLPIAPAVTHFSDCLPAGTVQRILRDPQRLPEIPPAAPARRRRRWTLNWRSWHRALSLRRGARGPTPETSAAGGVVPDAPQPRGNVRKPLVGKPAAREPIPCGHDAFPSAGREPCQMGWYEWIARRHPQARFIDVGAGMGAGMAYLAFLGAASVRGFDVDERLRQVPGMTIGTSPLEVLGPVSCDVALCIDVVEHVVDDVPFVRELLRLATQAVYVSTPNFSRSRAANPYHAREYTPVEFANVFAPDEIWGASPDGWYHRTWLLERRGNRHHHRITGESWPLGKIPPDYVFNQCSPDGLEWAHFCAVFTTSLGAASLSAPINDSVPQAVNFEASGRRD